MALTLSKTGITTGGTVEAYQVTQSIDALTGTAAYDITISGSLTVTGSVKVNGSITGSLLGTSSFAVSASRAITASFALSTTSTFPFSGSAVITGSLNVTSTVNSPNINGSNILNIGTPGTANQDLKINVENGITINSGSFTPSNILTPDDWLIVQYTDNTDTLRTGHIPIYYTI
jgi:cytoskeletal protein CcmA (bactofilin family)